MLPGSPSEITDLLLAWRGGDGSALARLMPATYGALKAIAARLLRNECSRQSIATTTLVHEAYVRLANLDRVSWRDRAHFYAMTARLMRQILVDHARERARAKRGPYAIHVSLEELENNVDMIRPADLLALDDALRDLAAIHPEGARIVELRYFGGLNREEIAEVLDISSATVSRRWRSARAWLLQYLGDPSSS